MLNLTFVAALILAWFLDLFGFGKIFCNGSKELFGLNISIYGYYMIFFLVGLFFDIVNYIKTNYRKNYQNSSDDEE